MLIIMNIMGSQMQSTYNQHVAAIFVYLHKCHVFSIIELKGN